MTGDIGELIVETWLKEVVHCEFVEYGVRTQKPGEIDVVGLSLQHNLAYLCEAATHIQGLWYAYTTEQQSEKLVQKFQRAVQWANANLSRFPNRTYMLWTPVITKPSRPNVKLDHTRSVAQAKHLLQRDCGIDLQVVANDVYKEKLADLRLIAANKSRNAESPVLRLLQIEEWNRRYAAG